MIVTGFFNGNGSEANGKNIQRLCDFGAFWGCRSGSKGSVLFHIPGIESDDTYRELF